MVDRLLSVYQQEHGEYPDRLTQLTAPGFKVENALAGATYRYYKQPAASSSNRVLLDGAFRGYSFVVSSESGVSFR
jgi:hypothetical protein